MTWIQQNMTQLRTTYNVPNPADLVTGEKPKEWRLGPLCKCGRYETVDMIGTCMLCERIGKKHFLQEK